MQRTWPQRSEIISCQHPLLLYLIIRKRKNQTMWSADVFQSQLSPAAETIHHPSSTCVMWNCTNSVPFLLLQASVLPAALVYFQVWCQDRLVNHLSWSPRFHARETKRASNWLFQKKRHLAAERPAVSPIDPDVSPSLRQYRTICVKKQVRLQSLSQELRCNL